jgi:hypothetical protein
MVEQAYACAARMKVRNMLAAQFDLITQAFEACCKLSEGESSIVEVGGDGSEFARRSGVLRTRLCQRAETKSLKWSVVSAGPGKLKVTALAKGTRLVLAAAQPVQEPKDDALNRYEKEFFELALKFFYQEDQLSEEEWKRINDKRLPELARLVMERRKLEIKVHAGLKELGAEERERVVRFLWAEHLESLSVERQLAASST